MAKQQVVLTFEASEFTTARAALQHAEERGGEVIRLHGQYLVVSAEDANRLAAAGIVFAWVGQRDGLILTVPVND
jgi:hypothetical protein